MQTKKIMFFRHPYESTFSFVVGASSVGWTFLDSAFSSVPYASSPERGATSVLASSRISMLLSTQLIKHESSILYKPFVLLVRFANKNNCRCNRLGFEHSPSRKEKYCTLKIVCLALSEEEQHRINDCVNDVMGSLRRFR